jgi:hypothetical protein
LLFCVFFVFVFVFYFCFLFFYKKNIPLTYIMEPQLTLSIYWTFILFYYFKCYKYVKFSK